MSDTAYHFSCKRWFFAAYCSVSRSSIAWRRWFSWSKPKPRY